MASTHFTTGTTITSEWLNDVNDAVYNSTITAEGVQYTPPFTGGVTTNVENKLAETVSVKDFGAVGDGVTDDSNAIQNAINACPNKVISLAGGEFFIASDVTFTEGTILSPDGGYIIVDTGVTLTVSDVRQENLVCFKGSGDVVMSKYIYNMAWYEGDSFYEKMSFLRRGLVQGYQKTIVIPQPSLSDPACVTGTGRGWFTGWRLGTTTLDFDTNWNESTIYWYGNVVADAATGSNIGVSFGSASKPEEINFPVGLKLFGEFEIDVGVKIFQAARLNFGGTVRVWDCNMNGIDVVQMDETNASIVQLNGHLKKGMRIGSINQTRNVTIQQVFSNGLGVASDNLLTIEGNTTAINVGLVALDVSLQGQYGFDYNPTESLVTIKGSGVNNPWQIHLEQTSWQRFDNYEIDCPVVLITDETVAKNRPPANVYIGSYFTDKTTSYGVYVEYGKAVVINAGANVNQINFTFKNSIYIGANAQEVNVIGLFNNWNGSTTTSIVDNGIRTRVNGQIARYGSQSIANDAMITIPYPSMGTEPTNAKIWVCVDSSTALFQEFYARSDKVGQTYLNANSNYEFTNSVPTVGGSTAGKITIGVPGNGNLYIVNKIGTTETFQWKFESVNFR